jgi:hypothetical protein
LQQRANELYFDLHSLNHRNSSRIHKYLEGCFGTKRHINYDASGLYTQEEIRRLVQEQRERATARLNEVGELRGECSGEQLREYFKMQVELHEASVGLRGFARSRRLQEWFPLCLVKNGDKLHPYQLVAELNGAYLTMEEFEQRYGKKVKVYMRELLAEARGEGYDPAILQNPEYLRFPKKDFISYHQAKVLELINHDPPSNTGNAKKDLMPSFPNEDDSSHRKVKSEAKITNKSLVMPPLKPLKHF